MKNDVTPSERRAVIRKFWPLTMTIGRPGNVPVIDPETTNLVDSYVRLQRELDAAFCGRMIGPIAGEDRPCDRRRGHRGKCTATLEVDGVLYHTERTGW